jgi:dolichol-phosphate mannosyltransferase
VLPQKLYTYTSMFRAYRREVLENIPTNNPGFLGLVEIIAEAMLRGCKVVEYPTQLSNRRFGQSKLRVMRVIFHHLGYIKKLLLRRLSKKKTGRQMNYSLQSK